MSRFLVTGGAGRLGRSVVDVLAAAGHEVVSADRSVAPGLDVEQVAVDLLDASAATGLLERVRPDGVVHLAAIAVPFSAPDPTIFAVNTGLAYSVLEACLATGVRRLLTASSPTVVGYGAPGGWAPRSLPIDERHPRAPWNGYALSKVAIEELVAMAARRYGDALHTGAFRPCYVIAPEEWAGAPTQQGHTVRQRLDDPALSAVALFNYVDARDAGEFVLTWLAESGRVPNGETLFVSGPDSLVREPVADALARLVPGAAAAAAGLAPDAPVFSSARARDLLGWAPRHSWRTELADAATPAGSVRAAGGTQASADDARVLAGEAAARG